MDDKEKELVAKMTAQADALSDGWISFEVPECEKTGAPAFTVKLPRIPFERWMRGTFMHRRAEWTNVCPLGMKMMNDDRDHSDWWLGTGIPLEYAYGKKPLRFLRNEWLEPGDRDWSEPDPNMNEHIANAKRITDAAWMYKFDSTDNRTRNSIFLVSSKKEIKGSIFHVRSVEDIQACVDEANRWKKSHFPRSTIAVVPNCSVLFDPVIRACDAIITEIGSAAAHLVKVAREDKIPVIMCPYAFNEFFQGEDVKIKDKSIFSTR